MYAHILSDIHVGEHNKCNDVSLSLLVDFILMSAGYDDIVIAAGDLTHNGNASEYAVVRDELNRISRYGLKVMAVPGNHDCGEAGIFWDHKKRQHFDMFIARDVMGFEGSEPWPLVVKHLDYTFVLLDSQAGNEGELIPPLARGELGKLQLERLAKILRHCENVVLVLHHHPFWRDIFHAIEDNRELFSVLYGSDKPLKGVVFGHKHKFQVWRDMTRLGVAIASGKSTHLYDDKRLRYCRWDMFNDDVDVIVV